MVDVLIIGNDFSSYIAAYSLSKRGYSVYHYAPFEHYFVDHFKPGQNLTVCDLDFYQIGVHSTLNHFIEELGFLKETALEKPFKEILSDGRVLIRFMSKKEFKIYLYRHFAKEHKALDRWFSEIESMYQSFLKFQKSNYEKIEGPSPKIFNKIKGLNLQEWLGQFFVSNALKESINVFYKHEGESLENILVTEYLIQWFYLFEEMANPITLTYKSFVKKIKKVSHNVTYLSGSISSMTFDKNHYLITFNKDISISVKFILGNLEKKETKNAEYRWIDCDIEPKFYDTYFKERIVFKETPLFKHLSINPLHLVDESKKGYLRIEAISETHPDLLINYVSRYFPNLENAIKSSTERPVQHSKKRDYYNLFLDFNGLEETSDLFEQPKWIQVSLNDEFKPLLPYEIHKGLYYTNILDRVLKEEKNPSVHSMIHQLMDDLVKKFQPTQKEDFNLKIGVREFYFSSKNNGIVYDSMPKEKTIELRETGFLKWHKEKSMLHEDILNKEGKKLGLLEGLLFSKSVYKYPFGFIISQFMIFSLLIPIFFSQIPFFIPPVLIFISTVVYFGFSKILSRMGIFLTLLSLLFLSIDGLSNYYEFVWIISGVILFLSVQMNYKLVFLLDKDPIRNQLSDYYFSQFIEQFTNRLSLGFIIVGLLSLMNYLPAIIITMIGFFVYFSYWILIGEVSFKMSYEDSHDNH